jgi:hypothetical protein
MKKNQQTSRKHKDIASIIMVVAILALLNFICSFTF